MFSGTIVEFRKTAKKLDARGIYLTVDIFDEDNFLHFEGGKGGEEAVPIDLATRDAELAAFKIHLKEPYMAFLATAGGMAPLSHLIKEDWMGAFEEKLDIVEQELIDQAVESRQTKEETLVKLVRALEDDLSFVICSTQRAMMTYALKKHPMLKDLNPNTLRIEVQRLWDAMGRHK